MSFIVILKFYCNVKGSILHYPKQKYSAEADKVVYYILLYHVIGILWKGTKTGLEQNRV